MRKLREQPLYVFLGLFERKETESVEDEKISD